ncbi:MAG: hypothetical protein A2140_00340 [Candidatus Muproteobacteria bacterium RBG_16_62_13]|uniref:Prepilin-type N-terminal cleavage/methylation domain-containing protein n=1 Tax=Candidatus Muproteobacteria bacterium RBG_16_62_13 TaxID=1817756 RepID=A0A1F6T719_9PROT|nr:MAG: hypothetical protein A2140_00340 [Candidatus Muproteobacteria bacterium RBG_16_62_13]
MRAERRLVVLRHARVPAVPAAVRGVTLIELIAFIIIAGIAMVILVQVFAVSMRGSHTGKQLTQAVHLAQQRLEVIRGQRVTLGYTNFIASAISDPCQSGTWTTQPCSTTSTPAGNYAVSSTFSAADACGTGCVEVTVRVTNPDGATVSVLTTQFWNY